jgi:HSP20 family molecular chaperone IbpA
MAESARVNVATAAPAAPEKASGTPPQRERIVAPPVDVIERSDAFEVVLDMPGADSSSINVVVGRNTLTIEGRWVVATPHGYAQTRAEFVPCTYRSQLGINDKVDHERVGAEFKDGVLTVKLPKAHGAMPRRVEVVAG